MTPTNLIHQLGDIAHALDSTNRLRANQLAELMPQVVALTQRALPNVSDEQLLVWHEEQIAQIRGRHVGDAWAASEPGEGARLAEMEARKDAAYLERNQVVAALAKCFPSGVARTAIEGWSQDWHGCVYIDLPTGQASWHFHDSHAHLFEGLPPYTGQWDGHDTPEKYRRLASMATSPASEPGEVARLADKLKTWVDLNTSHEPSRVVLKEDIDRLARMATSPASEGQAGWVMVPREPTQEMRESFCFVKNLTRTGSRWVASDADLSAAWRAMLASAPQPASSPAELPGMWEESDLSGGATDCLTASSPVAAEGQKAAERLKELVSQNMVVEQGRVVMEFPTHLAALGWREELRQAAESLATPTASMADAAEPIDMVLHCPACGLQHIDAPKDGDADPESGWFDPGWSNPPHRSHLCHGCGHIWRPADVATNGVAEGKTRGKADSATPGPRGENAGGVAPAGYKLVSGSAYGQRYVSLVDPAGKIILNAYEEGNPPMFAFLAACATAWGLRIAEKADDPMDAPVQPHEIERHRAGHAAPDDLHTALQALRATQEACDVTQCRWCGHWGQGYADSDQPLASCHHEYTLMPWRALWPDGLKQDPTSGMG